MPVLIGGAGMAQWCLHLPRTYLARVRFRIRGHAWVKLFVGTLLCSEWFFSRFSPLLKNQHFQIPIRSDAGPPRKPLLSEWSFLGKPLYCTLHSIYITHLYSFSVSSIPVHCKKHYYIRPPKHVHS